MIRLILAGLAILALSPAAALAEEETDLVRQAALAERFTPFESAGGAEWEGAFATPFFRAAEAGGKDAVQMELQPGAYMIVALCNCESMDVTLVAPDVQVLQPVRFSEQAAMYSVDVGKGGIYLAGIDMAECAEAKCGFAIKAYRRK